MHLSRLIFSHLLADPETLAAVKRVIVAEAGPETRALKLAAALAERLHDPLYNDSGATLLVRELAVAALGSVDFVAVARALIRRLNRPIVRAVPNVAPERCLRWERMGHWVDAAMN